MRMIGARGTLIAALFALTLPVAAAAETIAVYASTRVEPLARALIEQFNRSASGDHAVLEVRPSAAGVHALTAGVAIVAIVDRPAQEAERRPHRVVFGKEPQPIKIAVRQTKPGQTPPAIYVNAANPMISINRRDLARIFVIGNPDGDVGRWDQLQLGTRDWARRIHLYGGRDNGGFVTNVRILVFGGRQFRSTYEALADDRAAVKAVRSDPFGIAIVEALPEGEAKGAKRLHLRGVGENEIQSATDPFSPYILAYISSRQPNSSTWRFLRFLLSSDGQSVASNAMGYSNLSAPELVAERTAIERMNNEPL